MWTDKETGKSVNARKICERGFLIAPYSPQELQICDFLSFLISQDDFASIQDLEDLADHEQTEETEYGISQIIKKWVDL